MKHTHIFETYNMKKIEIIGKGNIAWHLSQALKDSCQVNIRSSRTLEGIFDKADLYIICVSDNAISDVAKRCKEKINSESVVVHTSGATSIDAVRDSFCNSGVFYPLRSLTKEVTTTYADLPILIEGSSAEIERLLKDTARLFTDKILEADSEMRKQIHVASVISCNFANHLWALSDMHLKRYGMDFNFILPLIEDSIKKLHTTSPYESQTGPAIRKDFDTMRSHLKDLEYNANLQNIYQKLSESIIDTHFSN